MSRAALVAGFVIAIIVVGVASFYAGMHIAKAPVATTTKTVTVTSTVTQTKTVTVSGVGKTLTVTKTTTAVKPSTTTVVKTKTKTLTHTVTSTTTSVASTSTGVATWKPPSVIKAAWIYVGPVGDFGWSYMHDLGRRVVQALFKSWLKTTYVESVPESKLKSTIESLISKGYNVIFTTSFGYMEGTLEEAKLHPNVIFFHCSGYLRWHNMGTYFADLYQVYYLDGLIAGALTKTGHIGYVAAFLTPELVRHINAFAIGAKEVGEQLGKKIEVYVIETGGWYHPSVSRQAAATLVTKYHCDVLAYTQDSTAIIEYCEQLWKQKHIRVWVFSHYSPGWIYGPDVVASGQIVRWEVIYADILAKIKAGVYTPYNLQDVDYWDLLNSGAVEFGCWVFPNGTVMHINPIVIPILKHIMVKDKLTGKKMSVYDLVMLRYHEMKDAPMLNALDSLSITHKYMNITRIYIGGKEKWYYIAPRFDPFTGPLTGYNIKTGAKVTIPAGERLGHDALWTMQWFVNWVHIVGKK